MKSRERLILELKKLNEKLDRIGNNDRYMVYNANPWKFAFFNFLSGIFHSLGTLFGTIIIAGAIIYFFSKIDFTQSLSKFIQQAIPTPPPVIKSLTR